MHRPIAEPRFRQQLNKVIHLVTDKDFLTAALIALDVDSAWDLLDQASRDKVGNYIETGPAKEVVALLAQAAPVPYLKSSVASRISSLNVAELTEAVTSYGLTSEAVPRAVDLYTSVQSWVRANELTDRLILPLLPYLSEVHISEIIRSPQEKGADLPGSVGFSKFLDKICESQRIPPDQLDEMLTNAGLEHYASKRGTDA